MDALETAFLSTLKLAGLTFLIDIPWLLLIQNSSDRVIRAVQGSPLELRPLPGAIVYLLLGYLVQIPKTGLEAVLMGIAVYGVYDGTNYATLKRYDPEFAVMDTLWGGVLFWLVFKARQALQWD
jgi:uncharacterized membrane protein